MQIVDGESPFYPQKPYQVILKVCCNANHLGGLETHNVLASPYTIKSESLGMGSKHKHC